MFRNLRLGALVALLILAAGCSSLPKGPPPVTELNSRTGSLHKLGREHFRAGRLDKAEAYFDRALTLHAAVDDEAGVALCFLSKGRVELARGHHDEAQVDFRQAMVSASHAERHDLTAQALGGLAAVQLDAGNSEDAVSLLNEALSLPLADGCRERAVLLHDLGSARLQRRETEAAGSALAEALARHEANHDKQGIATVCYTLGLLREATGDRPGALAAARRALAQDKAIQNARGVRQDLQLLATLHERQGDAEAAADYRRRAALASQGYLP